MTRLTDADLTGKSINDNLAFALLNRADVIVTHNAPFDVQWIDRRQAVGLLGEPDRLAGAQFRWLVLKRAQGGR